MPVLGHAFAGLLMGEAVSPGRTAPRPAKGLWVPVLVGLAYLPDIAAQPLLLAGVSQGRVVTHSVLFAVVVSVGLAPILARLTGLSRRRAFVIILVSVGLHDLLDVLQVSDRTPWWPFSGRRVGSADALLPTSLRGEGLLFGALWAAWVAGRAVVERVRGAGRAVDVPARLGRVAWAGRGLTVTLVLLAAITHHWRDVRDEHLSRARALIHRERDYAGALKELALAERWPSIASPSVIALSRAEAFAGTGDRARAEEFFLRSLEADPTFFWAVAGLADLYASSDRPLDERRRLAAPYVARLRQDFARHPALLRVLARIERQLAGVPGRGGSAGGGFPAGADAVAPPRPGGSG